MATIAAGNKARKRDSWEIESDVRTLAEAHKIHADPARHKQAKDHAKKQLADMQRVASGAKPGEKK